MVLDILYSLREDPERVAALQKATLSPGDFGLAPDPALVGSVDWWAAIDRGELPVFEATGRISRVYWGSMGDWPEFELTSDEGERSTWTRLGDCSRYVEGLAARVRYVRQRYKSAGERLGLESRQVLEIAVEHSDRRSSPYPPGPAR
jgi:hypothetical protein